MAVSRLLRISRPLGLGLSDEVSSNLAISSMAAFRPRTLMCLAKAGLSSENPAGGGSSERNPVVVKAAGCNSACVLVSEPKTDKGVDLALLLANVADKMSQWRKFITKARPWRFHIQMSVEKAIIDCRFFTLLATAGSMLGSVLCFVEKLPSWIGMGSAMQAKSKLGHAVIMILQVQVMEKFKSIPVTNGVDLACFAEPYFYHLLPYSCSLESVLLVVRPRYKQGCI
ncbi:hypothetical protein DH2020_047354 [Rehmannia glutinosa]|uniref:Uncharacterized protein n=1 Tax=Rehmannia glutinosa TaxID=99300 RepID=A0ABR0UA94_REHGL